MVKGSPPAACWGGGRGLPWGLQYKENGFETLPSLFIHDSSGQVYPPWGKQMCASLALHSDMVLCRDTRSRQFGDAATSTAQGKGFSLQSRTLGGCGSLVLWTQWSRSSLAAFLVCHVSKSPMISHNVHFRGWQHPRAWTERDDRSVKDPAGQHGTLPRPSPRDGPFLEQPVR